MVYIKLFARLTGLERIPMLNFLKHIKIVRGKLNIMYCVTFQNVVNVQNLQIFYSSRIVIRMAKSKKHILSIIKAATPPPSHQSAKKWMPT